MSLLADLLSKYKAGSSRHGTEKSPILDIPPTLFKAQNIRANVRTFSKNHVILIVACLAFIALGAFMVAKFELLNSTAKKITPTSPRVAQRTAPPIDGTTSKAGPVPPALPPSAEPPPKARIILEEPAVPPPHKKKSRHPITTAPHPVQKVERPVQPAEIHTQPKTVPQPVIDTATRDSFLYLAHSAELAGDWRTALANYRKAQKIDPGNYVIMNNVAVALNNLGMFDEGVQEAERALAKKPNYVPALINAAIGYSSKGNTQKAVRLFTAATAFDPGNRSLVINLGILQERGGSLDAALSTYRRLADDGDPLALMGMARVYERKGNRLEAARTYRQIMALPSASTEQKKEVKRKLLKLEE